MFLLIIITILYIRNHGNNQFKKFILAGFIVSFIGKYNYIIIIINV